MDPVFVNPAGPWASGTVGEGVGVGAGVLGVLADGAPVAVDGAADGVSVCNGCDGGAEVTCD